MITLGTDVHHWRSHAKNTGDDDMTIYGFLQFAVCILSTLAAGFWLQSTTSRLTKPDMDAAQRSAGAHPSALLSQSRWNAAGAACAGTAAFAQSVAVLLPYVGLR